MTARANIAFLYFCDCNFFPPKLDDELNVRVLQKRNPNRSSLLMKATDDYDGASFKSLKKLPKRFTFLNLQFSTHLLFPQVVGN